MAIIHSCVNNYSVFWSFALNEHTTPKQDFLRPSQQMSKTKTLENKPKMRSLTLNEQINSDQGREGWYWMSHSCNHSSLAGLYGCNSGKYLSTTFSKPNTHWILLTVTYICNNTSFLAQFILLPPTALLDNNYYYYIRLMAFFQDNLGKPAPER